MKAGGGRDVGFALRERLLHSAPVVWWTSQKLIIVFVHPNESVLVHSIGIKICCTMDGLLPRRPVSFYKLLAG